MNKEKYQESLNDIIKNCNGFPCKNDSFYNMQELIDNRYMEYLLLLEKHNRLNNVINELEKYIIHTKEFSWDDNGAYDDILDKLKELKEEK